MEDTFSPLLEQIAGDLSAVDGIKGSVVANSQQISGSLSQRQEPPLSKRISKDHKGAEAQKALEAAKSHTAVVEDESRSDAIDDAVVDKYVDELLSKFFGSIE